MARKTEKKPIFTEEEIDRRRETVFRLYLARVAAHDPDGMRTYADEVREAVKAAQAWEGIDAASR